MSQDSENNKKVTGPHRFKKGDKRPAGAGRRRGVPNRLTIALKDAIIAAAETAGEKKYSKATGSYTKCGPGGLLGYVKHLALHREELFTPLLAKVLPMHVSQSVVSDRGGGASLVRRARDRLRLHHGPRRAYAGQHDRRDDGARLNLTPGGVAPKWPT
jgi:hypothetical protein